VRGDVERAHGERQVDGLEIVERLGEIQNVGPQEEGGPQDDEL
jgi:hypothetical protein